MVYSLGYRHKGQVNYPRLFELPTTEILTVLPERTFWEKVTILHREAYRPESSVVPSRYSRHYYDLWCMASSPVKASDFSDLDFLEKAVRFKGKIYRCAWAKYEEAKHGTIKLIPSEKNVKAMHDHYEHMKNMIFGETPDFDVILDAEFRSM